MSIWSNSSAESGILRKNDQREKLEELLVFGYACKLFRDDEKALEIDQGKHLIPWMGDNSLKIDRYDARGTLSDLKSFESSKEGFDAMRWLGLSESERKLEQLCDEERYFALNTNEEEDELYKEEELKRAQSNQIQYSYEEPQNQQGPTLPEEDNEPFIPPPDLDVPINMTLPSTVKQNARIEKTALFISREGPQMEILLKTKQAGNPQFAFLTQDDPLYRYYRHVLMAIKTGRYKIKSDNSTNEEEQKKEETHYLHPSLAAEPITNSFPVLPVSQISYKPSANCAYTQLVTRIQGHQPTSDENNFNHPVYVQQYQQYNYQYFPQFDQNQLLNVNQTNPYAQIVSNVKSKDDLSNYQEPKSDITKGPVLYSQKAEPQKAEKPFFALAEYSDSASENENEENDENSSAQAVVVPPVEIQLIIDKMASYVAKNGQDFETIVRSKGDGRFVFLEKNHLYNPYYNYKLKECQNKIKNVENVVENNEQDIKVEETKTEEDKSEKKATKIKEKKIITPVSFSIKKPKDADSVSRDKSALPIEDSTDDEEPSKNNQSVTSGSPDQLPEVSQDPQPDSKDEKTNIIEIEDSIMELIDLTDEFEEKRDKRAEDRLKDKIVMAAREKLAEKNRALQMERKKRAAMFLSQLNSNKSDLDEGKKRPSPELGELPPEDISRLVYHIGDRDSPTSSTKNSKTGQKSVHHYRKTHKRSHSQTHKHKKEKKERDRKKTKRRHHSRSRSRSRSTSRYHKSSRRDESSDKTRRKREMSLENSSFSSENENDVQK